MIYKYSVNIQNSWLIRKKYNYKTKHSKTWSIKNGVCLVGLRILYSGLFIRFVFDDDLHNILRYIQKSTKNEQRKYYYQIENTLAFYKQPVATSSYMGNC